MYTGGAVRILRCSGADHRGEPTHLAGTAQPDRSRPLSTGTFYRTDGYLPKKASASETSSHIRPDELIPTCFEWRGTRAKLIGINAMRREWTDSVNRSCSSDSIEYHAIAPLLTDTANRQSKFGDPWGGLPSLRRNQTVARPSLISTCISKCLCPCRWSSKTLPSVTNAS